MAADRTLKDQNKRPLATMAAANVVLFFTMAIDVTPRFEDLAAVRVALLAVLPLGIGVALVPLLVGIMSPETKARLVYWRWNNPLPASRAFSELANHDPRIDIARLTKKAGDASASERDQNATWYRLYRTVSDTPVVRDCHRAFLFARDFAALSFLMLLVLGPLSVALFSDSHRSAIFCAVLAAQYLIARAAAANFGRRLVTTVLALKSTGK